MESDFKIAFEKLSVCVANLSCGVKLSEDDLFYLDCLHRLIARFELEAVAL